MDNYRADLLYQGHSCYSSPGLVSHSAFAHWTEAASQLNSSCHDHACTSPR